MLCAVLELLRPLPGGKVRPAGGEADLHYVGEREVLEQLCALRLEDADAGGDGVGEETAIGAVLVRSCGHFGSLEALDGLIVGCATNETKALRRAV